MKCLFGMVRAFTAVAWLGPLAMAQSTWVVPTGADLTSYIQAATPGDTLVLGAEHPSFFLNKGLNLIGNGTQIMPRSANDTTQVVVPTGQRASLHQLTVGIVWMPLIGDYWNNSLVLSGDVLMQSCQASSYLAPVRVNAGNVQLRDCTMLGAFGSAGLILIGGTCSLVGSAVYGANGANGLTNYDGGPGILVLGGNLWISGSQVDGGDVGYVGGDPSLLCKPALVVNGGTVQVAGSTLRGGDGAWGYYSNTYGSPAIQVFQGVVNQARNTLTLGYGPIGSGPTVGNVLPEPRLVGIRSTGTLALGATFTVQSTAGSAQMPLVVAANLQSNVGMHPLVAQPVLDGNGLVVQTLAAAPTPGAVVSSTTTIPNLVALRGVCVSWQAFQWTGGLVQASAIVGEIVN